MRIEWNHKIRKITPAGIVTTIAGTGTAGFSDGPAANAQFSQPCSVSANIAGDIFVADTYNHKIRKISAAGMVTTIAGSSLGFADGPGASAMFNYPACLVLDARGNIYVADLFNYRIRKISYPDEGGTSPGVTCPLAAGISQYSSDAADNSQISIFPNPNSGSFKIQIENEINNGELILMNSLGQKIFEQKIVRGENEINTNGLSNGLYYYSSMRDKQQVGNGKVVIE